MQDYSEFHRRFKARNHETGSLYTWDSSTTKCVTHSRPLQYAAEEASVRARDRKAVSLIEAQGDRSEEG